MRFEWDVAKAEENLVKHGVSFATAVLLFGGPMRVRDDVRRDYGEPRWVGFGEIADRVYAIVWTRRPGDTIRIISARKANERETKAFRGG